MTWHFGESGLTTTECTQLRDEAEVAPIDNITSHSL